MYFLILLVDRDIIPRLGTIDINNKKLSYFIDLKDINFILIFSNPTSHFYYKFISMDSWLRDFTWSGCKPKLRTETVNDWYIYTLMSRKIRNKRVHIFQLLLWSNITVFLMYSIKYFSHFEPYMIRELYMINKINTIAKLNNNSTISHPESSF